MESEGLVRGDMWHVCVDYFSQRGGGGGGVVGTEQNLFSLLKVVKALIKRKRKSSQVLVIARFSQVSLR